jgi:hypothetical protein
MPMKQDHTQWEIILTEPPGIPDEPPIFEGERSQGTKRLSGNFFL